MKYIIRKYQVIYQPGQRDRSNLIVPIVTDDLESVRARIKMKYTAPGLACIGINFEFDEINIDSV